MCSCATQTRLLWKPASTTRPIPSWIHKERPRTFKVRPTEAIEHATPLTTRPPCIEALRSDHAVAVVHGAIEQSDDGRACTVSWARVAVGAAISWALGSHGCITIERLCMQPSAGLWRGAAARLGDHQGGGPARCGAVAAPQVCWPGLSWPWMAAAQSGGTIGERAGR